MTSLQLLGAVALIGFAWWALPLLWARVKIWYLPKNFTLSCPWQGRSGTYSITCSSSGGLRKLTIARGASSGHLHGAKRGAK